MRADRWMLGGKTVRPWISKLEALAVAQIFRKDAAASVEGVVGGGTVMKGIC